jgi:hypothetical protein
MSGDAFAPIPENPASRPARRALPILGVACALAVSAGLVWWFTGPESDAPSPAVVLRPHDAATPRAAARADPAQVQQAFEAVQDAYAEGGADGLARADADCAAALKADARVLDYCLAFNLFATAVAPQIAPADPAEARLAAARAALPPGSDPAARIAAVQGLMRMASLGQTPSPSPPRALGDLRGPAPVRLALTVAPTHVRPRHRPSPGEEQRREMARAAVRALFARAEAARGLGADAGPVQPLSEPPIGDAPH